MSDHQGLAPPRRRWAIAALWLGTTMAVLDASIANVALPSIARDLHAAPAASVWIVNAYQMTILVSLLPLASLGEIISYRRIYLGGLCLFTLASAGCALSPTLPVLGAARAVQGLGAAGLMSVSAALLRYTFPADRLGRMIGYNALVVSIAAVLGPTIASALLAVGPWPLLFWVNVPLGLPAVLMAARALPETARISSRLDWISAGLNVLAFGLIFIGADVLARARLFGWGGAEIALGLLAAAALAWRSFGQTRPLLPIDLLGRPLFALSVLTSVVSFAAQALAFVALPFYLQDSLGRSPVATGLVMAPWPIAVGVAAPLAGRLADRIPAAILSCLGLLGLGLGLTLLALVPAGASDAALGLRMALCGAGFGFFQTPNNQVLLSEAPMARSGAAGGMLATARLTGQTVGATTAAILFALGAGGPRLSLFVGGACAAGAAVVSVSRLAGGPRRAGG